MNISFLNIELEILAFVMLLICFFFNLKLKEEKGFKVLKLSYIFAFAASVFNILSLMPYEYAIEKQAPFLYYICIGIVGFLWLVYCFERFNMEKLNKARLAFLVPFLLAMVIVIAYKVMQIFLLSFVFYIFLSAIILLSGAGRISLREKEERVEVVCSSAPAVFLGALLQIFVPLGLMSVTLSIALSFMVLLVNSFKKKMMSDELTELSNRYGMKEELEQQFAEYKRDKNDSFYVIACDMDNFKDINDDKGHDEGDRALKIVSKILTKVADRNEAKAFRYGGDEFFIITDKSEKNVAERICKEVREELRNTHFRDDFKLEISMGIKLFDGISSEEELLKGADESLYDDKRERKAEKTM